MHETNQIISLFGQYFMALDWDYNQEMIYGFESFSDNEIYIDVIGALPDNNKVLLYSHAKKKIFKLSRNKPVGVYDRVYEQWTELSMGAIHADSADFFNSLDDDLDFIDILAYQIVTAITNWFNPIDR
jgi:hypothetical protein